MAALFSPGSLRAAQYSLQQSYAGEASSDQFGFAVAPAGDVDGDGLADFLVGANVSDEGAPGGGKAYLYCGALDVPPAPSLTLTGSWALAYFGASFAGGGDLDGDGFDDWAVGAPGLGTSGVEMGTVQVFLGGRDPDGVPDLILEGTASGGQFGEALAFLDFNGDGYDDLAIGAPRAGKGRVHLFKGGPRPLNATVDRVFRARDLDERFGKSLARIPDDDGDGKDDLLVGAPRSSEASAWAGAALLFRGTANLDATPDLVLLGEAPGDEFGSSLSAGADVSGDGFPDLLVGAPAANVGGMVDAGRAYVFFGGAPLDNSADVVFSGLSPEDRFGSSVVLGFDWNEDGSEDLAVGAPNRNAGAIDAGAIYVFFGGGGLDGSSDRLQKGPVADAHLGKSLALAGDLRHDGRGALIAGGFGALDAGRVLLFGVNTPSTGVESFGIDTSARLEVAPNPFRSSVWVSFASRFPAGATLEIRDVAGRLVRTLEARDIGEAPSAPAAARFVWDGRTEGGRSAAPGVYFLRVEAAGFRASGKLVRAVR